MEPTNGTNHTNDTRETIATASTNDDATKPWYASTGVWGALVALVGSSLTLLKVQLDPQLLEDVRQWLLSLVTLVGAGIALWGRIRATRRIAMVLLVAGTLTLVACA